MSQSTCHRPFLHLPVILEPTTRGWDGMSKRLWEKKQIMFSLIHFVTKTVQKQWIGVRIRLVTCRFLSEFHLIYGFRPLIKLECRRWKSLCPSRDSSEPKKLLPLCRPRLYHVASTINIHQHPSTWHLKNLTAWLAVDHTSSWMFVVRLEPVTELDVFRILLQKAVQPIEGAWPSNFNSPTNEFCYERYLLYM